MLLKQDQSTYLNPAEARYSLVRLFDAFCERRYKKLGNRRWRTAVRLNRNEIELEGARPNWSHAKILALDLRYRGHRRQDCRKLAVLDELEHPKGRIEFEHFSNHDLRGFQAGENSRPSKVAGRLNNQTNRRKRVQGDRSHMRFVAPSSMHEDLSCRTDRSTSDGVRGFECRHDGKVDLARSHSPDQIRTCPLDYAHLHVWMIQHELALEGA